MRNWEEFLVIKVGLDVFLFCKQFLLVGFIALGLTVGGLLLERANGGT